MQRPLKDIPPDEFTKMFKPFKNKPRPLDRIKLEYMMRAIVHFGYNRQMAADALCISYRSLAWWVKSYEGLYGYKVPGHLDKNYPNGKKAEARMISYKLLMGEEP